MVKFVEKNEDTIKVRFIRNTAWEGTDYGPDYKKAEAELPAWYARNLIAKGRCVEVVSKPEPKTDEKAK